MSTDNDKPVEGETVEEPEKKMTAAEKKAAEKAEKAAAEKAAKDKVVKLDDVVAATKWLVAQLSPTQAATFKELFPKFGD